MLSCYALLSFFFSLCLTFLFFFPCILNKFGNIVAVIVTQPYLMRITYIICYPISRFACTLARTLTTQEECENHFCTNQQKLGTVFFSLVLHLFPSYFFRASDFFSLFTFVYIFSFQRAFAMMMIMLI